MATLLISDLHLCAERPGITELFLRFMRERASRAEALYILGDLFEYWVGDDAAPLPANRPIVDAIAAVSDRGVPVAAMRGNRDFLLGEEFARLCGAQLLPETALARIGGLDVVLLHGDSLCTDDAEHQAWRRQVLSPEWQRQVLATDLASRIAAAEQLRRESEARKQGKTMEIMDVNQGAVESVMREHGVLRMIHGHTHRPAVHRFMLDGQEARRYVLGDWYTQGSVLVCDDDDWRLETLPPG
jgi:UDP-2,3-diacylglucosamine hydrolase